MTQLDGYKTTVGGALLTAGAVIDQVIIGIWHASISWLPQVGSTLDWVGMCVCGVGLTHKGVKLYQSRKNGDAG